MLKGQLTDICYTNDIAKASLIRRPSRKSFSITKRTAVLFIIERSKRMFCRRNFREIFEGDIILEMWCQTVILLMMFYVTLKALKFNRYLFNLKQ